jgi:flagellar motor switch protein FliN/FliY
MADELQDRIDSLLKGALPQNDDGDSEPVQSQNQSRGAGKGAAAGKQMSEGDHEAEEKRKKNLNMILDIPLEVSVELGRNKMLINDLLQLGQGSIIELNKLAGEPLEVLVNGRLVARGEVVVIHDKFGVRLTDIISPNERIQQLGGA